MVKDEKASKKEKVEVTLRGDRTLEPTRIYSNFAQISHTPFDFTITFCDATALDERTADHARKTGEHRVPVVAEIAIPVNMVQSLVDALKIQLKKYQKNYGGTVNVEQAEEKPDLSSTVQ